MIVETDRYVIQAGQRQPLATRQTDSYSDTLTSLLLSRAQGKSLATVSATAALETCAGAVGRAFMGAEIKGRAIIANLLTPSVLELIGRALIRRGESVFIISTDGGDLKLYPAESWDIDGSVDPDTWEYRVTAGGPSGTLTWPYYPATSVLHFRYAIDASNPWRGNGPIDVANIAGRLSSETANALAAEMSGPVGRMLPLPADGQDDTIEKLRTDIAEARGRVAFIESGDWDNTSANGVNGKLYRFGAEPGQPLVNLLMQSTREIYSACGFNPSLFVDGDSASLREAHRLALVNVYQPLAKLIESEIAAKLDSGIVIDFAELRASDLQGRARSFQSMVGGGMDMERAAALSGLLIPEPE